MNGKQGPGWLEMGALVVGLENFGEKRGENIALCGELPEKDGKQCIMLGVYYFWVTN